MTELYRATRVIEYIGTLDWINNQKKKDGVKGTKVIEGTEYSISSAYIGEPIKLKKHLIDERKQKLANDLADDLYFAVVNYGDYIQVKALSLCKDKEMAKNNYKYGCTSYNEVIDFLVSVKERLIK